MLAAETTVKNRPTKCDQGKYRKEGTLQQEGRERSEGMQRGEEVETEKESEWNEQSDLAYMENASLDPAAKRETTRLDRDLRCEEADNHYGKRSAYKGRRRGFDKGGKRFEITGKYEDWKCCHR